MLILPDQNIPERIGFVSDLHLFSSRSTAAEHQAQILRVARETDLMVFGGDLFDFRWSRVGNAERTSRRAIEWLDRMRDHSPERPWVYIYGNHDSEPIFRELLDEWAKQREGIEIDEHLVRIGDCVLLHGDAIEGGHQGHRLGHYRARWATKPRASGTASAIYDAAVAMRAHCIASAAAHRHPRTFRRLVSYLDAQGQGPAAGVRQVIFGHTHRTVEGIPYRGVDFHNCGAAIRSVRFQPVIVEPRASEAA